MKILYISQYFPPETGAGATRAEAITRHLREQGWQVDVLCEMPNYPSGVIDPAYRGSFFHETHHAHGKTVRTWVIPTKRETFLQQLGMFFSWLMSSTLYGITHTERYDAVYATSPPMFGALSGLLLSRLYRVPFFFEVRDLWPDAALETGHIQKTSLSYTMSKALERLLYRKANLVIPVTARSEDIIRKTEPAARTRVIYNGVDSRLFRNIPDANNQVDHPKAKGKFRVGYAGSIGVIHDMPTVVKAARLLEEHEDIEFLLIGDGSRSAHLEAQLAQSHPSNLTWIRNRPHDQIPAWISTMDLALNPVFDTKVFRSIITVKFFEYLACEVPVISSASGLLEQVGNASGAAATIQPQNPELLAQTILDLKNDPDRRAALKACSRPFVLRYFERSLWAQCLSEVLKTHIDPAYQPSNKAMYLQREMAQSGFNW